MDYFNIWASLSETLHVSIFNSNLWSSIHIEINIFINFISILDKKYTFFQNH
jgi:hypothetical protein